MAGVVLYEFNITIQEMGTYDKIFRWLVNSIPVSLLNYTGVMQVRRRITDVNALINIPFVSSIWEPDGLTGIYLVDSGLDGKYRIYINDSDTTNICPDHKNSNAMYTLFLYNSFGESVLKQHGQVSLIASGAR